MDKPVIQYPCTWSYRVIGADKETMLREIPEKLSAIKHSICAGNRSAKGTYISINVEALVNDEQEQLAITPLLQSIPTVKMVI